LVLHSKHFQIFEVLRIAIAVIPYFLIGAYLPLVHSSRAIKQEGPTLLHLIVKYFSYKNKSLHLESIHIEKSFCIAEPLLVEVPWQINEYLNLAPLLMRGPWPLMQMQQKEIHLATHIASHIHIVTHARFTYTIL